MRYRQISTQTASKRQSQASETKLLAWPQSCCQPSGTQEQARQRTCHGYSRPFTSPAVWLNGSAHSRLSQVLSLSLQTLVEEEPLQSLCSPVLQEVFITITDFRWDPHAPYACILLPHSGPVPESTDMLPIFDSWKLFRKRRGSQIPVSV